MLLFLNHLQQRAHMFRASEKPKSSQIQQVTKRWEVLVSTKEFTRSSLKKTDNSLARRSR